MNRLETQADDRVELFGAGCDPVTFDEAVERLREIARQPRPSYAVTANVDHLGSQAVRMSQVRTDPARMKSGILHSNEDRARVQQDRGAARFANRRGRACAATGHGPKSGDSESRTWVEQSKKNVFQWSQDTNRRFSLKNSVSPVNGYRVRRVSRV